MQEFDFIDQLLKPLVGQRALDDDTSAVIPPARLVLNTDTLVAKRHFFEDDPADLLAQKLVRVNISDLASTGARPRYLSLNLTLNRRANQDWMTHFVAGLAKELSHWQLTLLGGDTTWCDGPMVLSASVLGDMEARQPMRRWLAQPGQGVWLGRQLGLGRLGLAARQTGELGGAAQHYLLPQPQLELGLALAEMGGEPVACADVSDGLGADLGHIARASGVRIELVEPELIPVAPGGDINGGDDYCLVAVSGTDLSQLGMVQIGETVQGQPGVMLAGTDISRIGYEHGSN